MLVYFVVGPTASGKTELALRLAQKVGGEIISADSMQIYTHMDIGTAKATVQERSVVPHHLIDFVDPRENYSVAQFQQDALRCIEQIAGRGNVPIVAGGTGLYVWSLLYPWQFSNTPENPEIREKWVAFSREMGEGALHAELQKRDPAAAARLHPNDIRRVVRALEIFETTGTPMRTAEEEKQLPFEVRMIGLLPPREQLYQRINIRVERMLQAGLVDEVKSLLDMGVTAQHQSMQGLGYRQVLPYLEGVCTLEQMRDEIAMQTRRYAKRQIAWFKRDERLQWIDPLSDEFSQNWEHILS